MTSNLKRWIQNGAPDKGDLEEDSYKILKQGDGFKVRLGPSSIGKGPQETKVPTAVNRVIGIQRSMLHSHGLQSGAGNDRSFHEICRGSPLHDSISGRNMRSLDKYVDS